MSSTNGGGGQPRMVKLAELWERTSAEGTRYYSGFMGDAQVLLFDSGEREHPRNPGEVVRVLAPDGAGARPEPAARRCRPWALTCSRPSASP
ncbi:MAG: hypothetical protein U1E17_12670 [Geminicoccaceae bacterium]